MANGNGKKVESFGEQLKKVREKNGLSQGDVAYSLGYSTAQFVSNWERDLSFPPLKAIKKLCKMYKLDPEIFFESILEATLEATKQRMINEWRRYKKEKV